MADDKMKVLVDAGFALAKLGVDLSHGVSASELGDVITIITTAGPAMAAAGDALKQYEQMSDDDAKDIEAYVAANPLFVQGNDTEVVILTLLKLVIDLHSAIALILPK